MRKRMVCLLFTLFFILPSISSATPLPDYFKKADAVNEYVYKTYQVHADGSYSMTLKMQVSIKTYKGKKDWADFRYPYNAEYERVVIDRAETILPSGKVIKASKKEKQDIIDPSTSERSIYSRARLKIINFPSVEVGTKIRFQITVVSKLGFWLKESFRLINPTIIKQVKLILPANMRLFTRLKDPRIKFQSKKKKGSVFLCWTGKMLPPLYEEPFSPEIENQPFCLIASSFGSEKSVASFFSKKLLKSVEKSPLKGPAWAKGDDPDVLYKEILSHVSIYPIDLFDTYLKVQTPETTINKSYGRPIDLAILFRAILRKKGITSHLVLVNTKGVFIMPLKGILYPALFNQVLVHAKGHFYSFQDKDMPPGITCVSGAYGIDMGSQRLVQVKDSVENSRSQRLSIRVYPQGNGIGNFVEKFSGASTLKLREMLRNKKGKELEIQVSKILHRIDPALSLLSKFHADGIEELSSETRMGFRFGLDPIFMKSENLYLFPVPESDLLKPYLRCLLNRHYGISIPNQKTEKLSLKLSVPEGMSPLLRPLNTKGKAGLLSWQIKTCWKNGEFIFTRNITLHRGIISKDEAVSMIKKIREINGLQQQMILFHHSVRPF